jgi:hypothetical protein
MYSKASFLSLPLELRLIIYALALEDSRELTIGTVIDRSAFPTKSIIPGIPDNQTVIVRNGFDEDLLSFISFAPQKWSDPTRTPISSGAATPYSVASTPGFSLNSAIAAMQRTQSYFGNFSNLTIEASPEPEFSPYSLLATCRQVQEELEDYMARRAAIPLKLHVSFPFGVIALQHMYPALLQSVCDIHIGGFYTAEWDKHISNETRAVSTQSLKPKHSGYSADMPSERGPNAPNISFATHSASISALNAIFETLAPAPLRAPLPSLKSISISTFTPKRAGTKETFEVSLAPCMIAMHHIARGFIDSWTWSNELGGTAWSVKITGIAEGQRDGRHMTNNWPVWREGEEDWMGVVSGKRQPDPIMDWGITL